MSSIPNIVSIVSGWKSRAIAFYKAIVHKCRAMFTQRNLCPIHNSANKAAYFKLNFILWTGSQIFPFFDAKL